MPHTITHCGTAGSPTGERTITIYTGTVMDYAVRLAPHEMAAYGVTEQEIKKFEKFYERNRKKLLDKLYELGVPYTVHTPHAENFEPHDH